MAIYQLTVTLRGFAPPIWRRFQVRGDTALAGLHTVLQVVMGWQTTHLHAFRVGERQFEEPAPDPWAVDGAPAEDESSVSLYEVAPDVGARFLYEYDFGDSWEHDLVVEAVLPPAPQGRPPVCLDGARACPPEDCGSVPGYEEILYVLEHPEAIEKAAPDGDSVCESADALWAWLPSGFEPTVFDRDGVNRQLAGIAR